MVAVYTLVAVVLVAALTSAAPQYYPAQTSYDADSHPPPSNGYWQAQEAPVQGPAPAQGPQKDNTGSITSDKPPTPFMFIPSLDDARKRFTGQVEGLPYPNFAGFPLYPFTPYAQGLWWR